MVEWKKIEEFAKCQAGATPSTKVRSYWDGGSIPWMNSGDVHQGVVTHTSGYITQLGYENSSTKMLPKDTVVIALAGQGKTRGTVAITDIELCTNQSICGIIIDNPSIRNKYIYYYLKTRYSDLRRVSSGDGTRGGLNLKMIGAYHIPIPSLSEQNRIVGILDTFTASIENLKEQIAQRRKQFEHYRDQLLDLEEKEGVKNKKLEDVCEIKGEYGLSVPSKPFDGIRYLRITDITESGGLNGDKVSAVLNEELKKEPLKDGDLLFARTGATVGKTLIYRNEYGPCLYAGYLIRYRLIRSLIMPQYMFHYTHSSKYLRWVSSILDEGAQPNINAKKYNALSFPMPSLSEQSRIVSILDTFEASIANLEAQLSQREKQYEYYRNKLLTFE